MVLQCWSYASYPKSTALFSHNFLLSLSDSKPHHQSCNYNANYKFSLPLLGMPSKSCKTSTSSKFSCFLNVGLEDIAGIAQNKVLIAAGVSAAIGQLSKPFTSVLLYGKDFDFKAAFRAGGFPSTHSSVCFCPFPFYYIHVYIFLNFVAAYCQLIVFTKAVVSTATCLALERGFSDSIFGLSVVYAGLVMYDSQDLGSCQQFFNLYCSCTFTFDG
ncbi:hypothetical protein GH714_015022 [Hevea brasiliensis]|uniref:Uncharacterized protein n=1 Tax=Hevea brasiliensis TaxID=3981 RepID=A0A6A6LRX9_HEVBR|nr:hypothetical protein GH714_015022 [Hevea brasiliensis]